MEKDVKNTTNVNDINNIAKYLNRHGEVIKLKNLLKSENKGLLTIGSLEENGIEKVKILFLDNDKNVKEWDLEIEGKNELELIAYILQLPYK